MKTKREKLTDQDRNRDASIGLFGSCCDRSVPPGQQRSVKHKIHVSTCWAELKQNCQTGPTAAYIQAQWMWLPVSVGTSTGQWLFISCVRIERSVWDRTIITIVNGFSPWFKLRRHTFLKRYLRPESASVYLLFHLTLSLMMDTDVIHLSFWGALPGEVKI